jgi:hypothetical protein
VAEEAARARDVAAATARLRLAYPATASKLEEAGRLHSFLLGNRAFTREALKLHLLREPFMNRPWLRESSFVKALLNHILEELAFRGIARREEPLYVRLRVPTVEECLDVLQLQRFDVWR